MLSRIPDVHTHATDRSERQQHSTVSGNQQPGDTERIFVWDRRCEERLGNGIVYQNIEKHLTKQSKRGQVVAK